MSLPELIRAYLAEHQLTQQQFADRVGVEQATVNRWIAGKRAPDTEMIVRLAEVMDVEPYDLVNLDEMASLGLEPASARSTSGAEIVSFYGYLSKQDRRTVLDLARSLKERSS